MEGALGYEGVRTYWLVLHWYNW